MSKTLPAVSKNVLHAAWRNGRPYGRGQWHGQETMPQQSYINVLHSILISAAWRVAFYENIDIVAHLAGLFCGIVFALIFICLPKREKKESPTRILSNNWLFALTPLPFSLYAIYVLLTS
jgi:membrane associated rhomboid family serine protease